MTAKLLLRIAAALMMLHTFGHTVGSFTWKDHKEPNIVNVVKGMESNYFEFMGRMSTYADFYNGYCFIMIIVLLLISNCLWLFSNWYAQAFTRQLIAVFGIFLIATAVLEYIYFFPFAAAMSFLAGLAALVSLYVKPKIAT